MTHSTSSKSTRLDADQRRRADAHFRKMLREGSNLEMDWLWLATLVTRDYERVYCLQRALYINPQSELAARGLAQFVTTSSVSRPFAANDTTKGECTQ